MRHVTTHKSNPEYSVEKMDKWIASFQSEYVGKIVRDMSEASSLASIAIAHGAWARTIGNEQGARRLFSIGVDYSVGAFLAFTSLNEPVSFTIESDTIRAPGIDGKTRAPTPTDWIECLALALCLRRQDALDILTAFPVERFRRGWDLYWKPLCIALQKFITNDPTWTEFDTAAHELTQEARTDTPKTIARYMSVLPTLRAIAADDQEAFTDALVAMLQAHKAQEGRGADKDSGPSLLAEAACGMAALGLQRGLLLDVESGYMPAWLVKNEAP